METREQREAILSSRVSQLRAKAAAKEAQADKIYGSVNNDPAFWTQPAYGNAGGRSFSSQRERERERIRKAGAIAEEAKNIRQRAEAMEARGAVMAGDAEAKREEKVASTDVKVGQVVKTIYGDREVIKVNKKTVLVAGSTGTISVPKHLINL